MFNQIKAMFINITDFFGDVHGSFQNIINFAERNIPLPTLKL